MKPFCVYHLIDPNTKQVRYVGKSRNPRARLASHIVEAKESQSTAKKVWIRGLLDVGMSPVLVIVAEYDTEAAGRIRESAECHANRDTILNIHDPLKGAPDFKTKQKPPAPSPC